MLSDLHLGEFFPIIFFAAYFWLQKLWWNSMQKQNTWGYRAECGGFCVLPSSVAAG
jgi:hypothetical protein